MRPRLVGALGLMCGDVHVAEELAQEALARTWAHWDEVRELGDPASSAWAYRVAMNLCRSWVRRRVAERRALARLAADARPHIGQDLADYAAVRAAVRRLPHRQRAAVVLRYYADLPVADVASLMGCAPGTVKSLTNLAIQGLRRQLLVDARTEETDGQ